MLDEALDTFHIRDRDLSKLQNKIMFLSDYIFDFTTYHDNISLDMAADMLNVLSAIQNRSSFEYISDDRNYRTYLTMINMPFLNGKLEWGTSIRGAWFDCCGQDETYTFALGSISVPKKEFDIFIKELLEWVAK